MRDVKTTLLPLFCRTPACAPPPPRSCDPLQMWQYVFFIVHLRRTPKTDLTGIELYVAQLLEEEDSKWFPLHKVCVTSSCC